MNEQTPDLASLFEAPPKNLTQKAYDLLLDSLIKRRIPAGSVLQERRLAEMFEISHSGIKEDRFLDRQLC